MRHTIILIIFRNDDKTIRGLHKNQVYTGKAFQFMVSKTSTFTSLYTIASESNSPSLRGGKT